MSFESSNFMILRNGKVQDKKHLKSLSKHFSENGKEKLFPNECSFLNNLKNVKQILSWQSTFSRFLQGNLLACSNVPHFSTKKESLWLKWQSDNWKWQTFQGKIWSFFMTSKKKIYFPYNTFVSYIC